MDLFVAPTRVALETIIAGFFFNLKSNEGATMAKHDAIIIGTGHAPAARCAVFMAPIVLTACQPAVLDPQGVIGQAEKMILIDSLAIMLAIVIPTIAATLAFAWWFRASNMRARYLPDWAFSGRIELIVWGIPLLVIMLLGGVAWIGSHDLDPAKPLTSNTPPLEVQVVSLDWKWLFIYPGQRVASVNRLVVPAGCPFTSP
jgi:cytochrome o ubiquinol oxidase subunit II